MRRAADVGGWGAERVGKRRERGKRGQHRDFGPDACGTADTESGTAAHDAAGARASYEKRKSGRKEERRRRARMTGHRLLGGGTTAPTTATATAAGALRPAAPATAGALAAAHAALLRALVRAATLARAGAALRAAAPAAVADGAFVVRLALDDVDALRLARVVVDDNHDAAFAALGRAQRRLDRAARVLELHKLDKGAGFLWMSSNERVSPC